MNLNDLFMLFHEKFGAMAESEGWSVFEVNRYPIYEIERDDAAGVFADDDKAIEHVTRMAEAGSGPHAFALAIHVAAEEIESG